MVDDLASYVAGQLRAEVARRQIPHVELARLIGVQETWVRRRLKGQYAITMSDLQRFAEALGVPLSYLIPLEQPARVA